MCNITEKLRKQFETFENSPNIKNINYIHIYIYIPFLQLIPSFHHYFFQSFHQPPTEKDVKKLWSIHVYVLTFILTEAGRCNKQA